MTKEQWAQTILIMNGLIGVGFCCTIIGAPLGIWFIRRGIAMSKEILDSEDQPIGPMGRAQAYALAASWDDVVMTSTTRWNPDD